MHALSLARRYKLNLFSLQLNDLPDELKGKLPPSDSRLRQDLRAAEEGRFAEVVACFTLSAGPRRMHMHAHAVRSGELHVL